MSNKYTVYAILDKTNNCIKYIGCSKNYESRFLAHTSYPPRSFYKGVPKTGRYSDDKYIMFKLEIFDDIEEASRFEYGLIVSLSNLNNKHNTPYYGPEAKQ